MSVEATATGVIPINYFGLNIQSYDYNFCARQVLARSKHA